jgi:hypothetical protein
MFEDDLLNLLSDPVAWLPTFLFFVFLFLKFLIKYGRMILKYMNFKKDEWD